MNVLSLFDGISTGRLALDMAGIRVDRYFSSEVEPAPMAVSAKHWPDVEQVGDCRQVKAADLPRIDLVIGGSPCQGFSRAGRHLNFDDPRSALFFEYARVLAEVRAINPAARFLLENVAMKKEWEAVITETLGVSPIHINSAKVSAQNRQRVYWTDIPGVKQPPERNIKLADVIDRSVNTAQYVAGGGILFDPTIPERARALVTKDGDNVRIRQATKAGYIVAEDGDGVNLAFPTSTTRRGRVIKGKSNALDCSCEACIFYDGIIRHFTITELERLQTLPDGYTEGITQTERKTAIGNGWTAEVIAWIFGFLKEETQ